MVTTTVSGVRIRSPDIVAIVASKTVTRSKRNAWTLAKREQAGSRRELILRAATTRLNATGYAAHLDGRDRCRPRTDDQRAVSLLRRQDCDFCRGTFDRALDLIERCIADAERWNGNGLSRFLVYVRAMGELIEAEPLPGGWHVGTPASQTTARDRYARCRAESASRHARCAAVSLTAPSASATSMRWLRSCGAVSKRSRIRRSSVSRAMPRYRPASHD